MDHQAKPGEKLADNPPKIWLAPRCNVDERTWCEDDIGCCDECGEPTIEYIRADIQAAEIARLRADLEAERASQCSAVDGMLTAEKEASRLRAENEQLRAAIQAAFDTHEGRKMEVARLQEAKRRALAMADERSKENVALRAALKPFAQYADPHNKMPGKLIISNGSNIARSQLTMADCYRAREALGE